MTRPYRPTLDEAQKARDATTAALAQLTNHTLERMYKIGHHQPGHDGFPASTTGDGHGNSELTSVEAAAIARINGHNPNNPDQVGDWLRLLFANLNEMGKLAGKLDGLRQLLTAEPVPIGSRERLIPPCIICDRDAPRPKRGMDAACYMAWRRMGCPDVAIFRAEYWRKHAEPEQEVS